MTWSDPPRESHFAQTEPDEDGVVHFTKISHGAFDGSDLKGAAFRGCIFRNADFRGAKMMEEADFFRAQGLEEAVFDDEGAKALAIASAARPA